MTWTPKRTTRSVPVDIDAFDGEQMLQGLLDAKWLTEDEASQILARAVGDSTTVVLAEPGTLEGDLAQAIARLRLFRSTLEGPGLEKIREMLS